MTLGRSGRAGQVRRRCSAGLLTALIVYGFPSYAWADFIWPPALYYFGATVWWAIPAGLASEYLVLLPFLRLSPFRLFRLVLLANAISAVLGLALSGPLIYWGAGVEFAARAGLAGALAVAAITFAVTVAVEYSVAVRWFQIRRGISLLGFVIANVASYAILFWAGLHNLHW